MYMQHSQISTLFERCRVTVHNALPFCFCLLNILTNLILTYVTNKLSTMVLNLNYFDSGSHCP